MGPASSVTVAAAPATPAAAGRRLLLPPPAAACCCLLSTQQQSRPLITPAYISSRPWVQCDPFAPFCNRPDARSAYRHPRALLLALTPTRGTLRGSSRAVCNRTGNPRSRETQAVFAQVRQRVWQHQAAIYQRARCGRHLFCVISLVKTRPFAKTGSGYTRETKGVSALQGSGGLCLHPGSSKAARATGTHNMKRNAERSSQLTHWKQIE